MKKAFKLIAPVAVMLLSVAADFVPGQQQPPTEPGANLVTIVAVVSDLAGNPVNDLTQDDFDVFEGPAKQDITGLYREGQMPLRLVFLFDTSTSMRSRVDVQKNAASLFFQRVLKPGDEGAIMSISTVPKLELQFSPDAAKLGSALKRLRVEGTTALYDGMADAAKYLRKTKGRRVILALSDGQDTISSVSLARAMAEVQKSDAVIYAVHPGEVAASAKVQDLAGKSVVKSITEETGGLAFFPPIEQDKKKDARNLEDIYNRISAEVRAQYVLTYYSKRQARDGRFQAITVKVRPPNLQVRLRRGYHTSTSQ